MKTINKKPTKELKEALKSEVSPLLIGLRNEIKTLIASIKDEVQVKVAPNGQFVAVAKGEKGNDGKDALVDYEKVFKEIEKMIPKPVRGFRGIEGKKGKDGKDGVTPIKGVHYRDGKDGVDGKTIVKEMTLTAQEIIDRLSDVGIPASMITGLETLIKKIAGNLRPWQSAGFGAAGNTQITTAIMPFSETPQGLIDGVNMTYTVQNKITAIIAIWINGQYIHPSTYSFSNKSFTFTSPLDASFAGLSFTIVYV